MMKNWLRKRWRALRRMPRRYRVDDLTQVNLDLQATATVLGVLPEVMALRQASAAR
jgi:hypothetical protein